MNSDHLTPDEMAVDRKQAGSGAARAERAAQCYQRAAPVAEVLEDQLVYLVNHGSGRRCFAACAECARLREVTRLLLKPFA